MTLRMNVHSYFGVVHWSAECWVLPPASNSSRFFQMVFSFADISRTSQCTFRPETDNFKVGIPKNLWMQNLLKQTSLPTANLALVHWSLTFYVENFTEGVISVGPVKNQLVYLQCRIHDRLLVRLSQRPVVYTVNERIVTFYDPSRPTESCLRLNVRKLFKQFFNLNLPRLSK